MNISSPAIGQPAFDRTATSAQTASRLSASDRSDPALREAFDSFVGETFYGQMLAAMRKSVGKAAYFHGGRAEEMFRGQLDQILAQEMSKVDGGNLAGSMFEQFQLSQLTRR